MSNFIPLLTAVDRVLAETKDALLLKEKESSQASSGANPSPFCPPRPVQVQPGTAEVDPLTNQVKAVPHCENASSCYWGDTILNETVPPNEKLGERTVSDNEQQEVSSIPLVETSTHRDEAEDGEEPTSPRTLDTVERHAFNRFCTDTALLLSRLPPCIWCGSTEWWQHPNGRWLCICLREFEPA